MNPFTTLNFDKLKEIADRWATQFQRQGGQYNRITLHRYEAPLLTEDTSLRWAIVFDITHYEYQDTDREEVLVNIALDPYWFLLEYSNFKEWVYDRRQNAEDDSHTTKFEQAFLKQSGFSTSPPHIAKRVNFPEYFMTNDFLDVYTVGAPENWCHQWLFIPLFKGWGLPHQVHIEDSVIIYPNDAPIESTEEYQAPGTLTEDATSPGVIDLNKWQLRFTGAKWEINFKGRPYSIDDDKPVRYMIPLIKQPGINFPYTVLCHIVSGEDVTEGPTVTKNFKDEESEENESDFMDGLNYQGGRIEMERKEEQIEKMKKNSRRVYQKYLSDTDREKETWKLWKAHVLDEYGLQIKERDGELMFKKPKHQSSVDKAESYRIAKNRVSQYKRRFLKQLEKKKHIELYEHFKQYLEPTGDGIQYRVPEGEPPWDWEVIE